MSEEGPGRPAKKRARKRRSPRGVYTITTFKVMEVSPGKWRRRDYTEPTRGRNFYLTYTLTGTTKRKEVIRKQSNDREELVGLKLRLETKDANAPDEQPVTSHLTTAQFRQAESAFLRLEQYSRTMGRKEPYALDVAIQHFIDTYYEPQTDKMIAQLAPEFMEELRVNRRCARTYLKSVDNDLRRFCAFPGQARKRYRNANQEKSEEPPLPPNAFGHLLPHNVTSLGHAQHFMNSQRVRRRGAPADAPLQVPGSKRWNNLRSTLKDFFQWMADPPLKYINKNPFSDVAERVWTTKEPARLSPGRALAFMKDVLEYRDGMMVPYFSLALFGGVRPAEDGGEIDKLSEHPKLAEQFNFVMRTVKIDQTVAKQGHARVLTMEPALYAWLKEKPISQYPIMPTNAGKHIEELRKRHKIGHDELRHSFISYLAVLKDSIPYAAMQAGNSEATTRKRYLNICPKEEAELFWQITPELLRDEKRLVEFVEQIVNLTHVMRTGDDRRKLKFGFAIDAVDAPWEPDSDLFEPSANQA